MNCFNHNNNPAVGVCKCCYRGLCRECASDLGHGIACKGKHETEVTSINMIIENNAKVYVSAAKNSSLTPILYLFMGFVFSGYALFSQSNASYFLMIMGCGFIIFGIITWQRSRAFFKKEK